MSERAPIVVAITGASGAPYAVRLLEALVAPSERVWLIDLVARLAAVADGDRGSDRWRSFARASAPPAGTAASRSSTRATAALHRHPDRARTRGMVICPCSMGTLAAIAAGTSRSLVERAAT